MAQISWQDAIAKITPHIVKITTPDRSGTGFLVASSSNQAVCGIATAAHVIGHAHDWQQPIRLLHPSSGTSALLASDARAVLLEEKADTAALVIPTATLPLPEDPLPLTPEGFTLRVGFEIGWLGFPAVSPSHLCFFSGRVSCWRRDSEDYLVDGVAIHGVSGGPALHLSYEGTTVIIGVVSAYMPNRAAGEPLPGLCVVRDVAQFQNLIKTLRNIGDAKETEREQNPAPDPEISDTVTPESAQAQEPPADPAP